MLLLQLRPLSHQHQLSVGLRHTATSLPGARDAPDELQIPRPLRHPLCTQALRCGLPPRPGSGRETVLAGCRVVSRSWPPELLFLCVFFLVCVIQPTWRCGCRVVTLVRVTASSPRPLPPRPFHGSLAFCVSSGGAVDLCSHAVFCREGIRCCDAAHFPLSWAAICFLKSCFVVLFMC